MKRHTKQSSKQKNGQYFTSNVSSLLKKYISFIKDKDIIDPFCGNFDLLDWAMSNGAKSIIGYDINPIRSTTIKRDTLNEPPDYSRKFLLTNPPYLCSNKNKDKKIYKKYNTNDLYKCFLISIINKVDEGIIILPSNFLSESRDKIRNIFFSYYNIDICDYYYYSVFPSATTGIVIFHFIKSDYCESRNIDNFYIHYSRDKIIKESILLHKKYKWLYGEEFFEYIDGTEKISVDKYIGGNKKYLSNIVVGLLDKGKWKQGLSYNESDPIVCGEKSFTTYQIVFPFKISEGSQIEIVKIFNEKMDYFRNKYHGLFLSNYMGANQKIYSRDFINKMIIKIMEDLNIMKTEKESNEGLVFIQE